MQVKHQEKRLLMKRSRARGVWRMRNSDLEVKVEAIVRIQTIWASLSSLNDYLVEIELNKMMSSIVCLHKEER